MAGLETVGVENSLIYNYTESGLRCCISGRKRLTIAAIQAEVHPNIVRKYSMYITLKVASGKQLKLLTRKIALANLCMP